MKMKNKHIPISTCVYTRTKASKYDMIRLTLENDTYVVDDNMVKKGRGIYIYPCEKVKEILYKNKKYNISDLEKEKILNYITKKVGDFNGK